MASMRLGYGMLTDSYNNRTAFANMLTWVRERNEKDE